MDSVVTVCTGHRCAALLEHAPGDCLPSLRSAVRASRQAVLVSTGCVGACAQAPVMALSEGRGGRSGLELRNTRWLGPVGPVQVEALCGLLHEPLPEQLPTAVAAVVFHQVGQ